MPTLQVRFFGTLDLREADRQLSKPPTLKSQSLLAYLIRHRHQPQPRERLAGLFWGDRPDPKARHSLATALWHIRRCLPHEAAILSEPGMVQFDPQADVWLDVDRFESEVAHNDAAHLESAVALYRGDFLDGFYDDWILNERYRLETLFADALARLMAGQEAGGYQGAALSTALRLLQHDPAREDAHRQAMRAYCRLGQRNAALEQYRRCRETVQEELGAEPMVETTDLYQAILEGRFAVGHARGLAPSQTLAAEPIVSFGRSPLDAIAPSKLVGRERELEFLQDCWQRAGAGQGGLVLMRGEAGVGKTRLAEEFASRMRWQGVRVLWGRCYEFERLLPYQPVSEALRTILPSLTAAELAGMAPWAIAEVARLVPEMAEQTPGLEPSAPADATQEQARLFDGVACFLSQLSSNEALLMVVEDLHWASESTLQMLHYLSRTVRPSSRQSLAGQPFLLLGTARTETVGRRHPLRALQRRLSREGLAQLLRLPHLSPEAVEAMVVEMSGAGDSVAPLAERLYRETEGNPFFLVEIVKALFEAKLVYLEQGAWRGDFARISEGELPLPASLSETIQARVDSLNDEAQQVLRLAAVLGREFDFDLLNPVWGQGEEATLEALDVLLRRRLLDEGSGAVGRDYAFTHHKIQEVVYAGLPRRRRQHAHAQVGAAMERLYGTDKLEALAGELAYHFEQGRELDRALTEKAIAYLLQAGDRARALYAHQEAINYYQRALVHLKEQGDAGRAQAARTLMKLGLTYHNAFDFQRARQAYEEGFTLWQQAGELPRTILLPAPHALRLSWPEPTTLDAALANDLFSNVVIEQLFSGLVERTPEKGVVPDVARSWEVSESGRKYIFHLRDDVRWSDGTPVTTGDFVYAWKRMLDPLTGSPQADMLYDIRGARAFHQGDTSDPEQVGVWALDKVTLVVELEEPTGDFPVGSFPVPRHVVEAHGTAWTDIENIVTNGPFRVEAWQPGESLILVRNPEYGGRFRGNVQRLKLFALEWSAALDRYGADGLDVWDFHGIPLHEVDLARQRHATDYVSAPWLGTIFVGFDASRPPFDDPRVRRAFVHAIDRAALADVVMRGYVFPALGGFVPPGMPGHSAGIALQHDLDRAQRLLAEAGYPGGRGFPTVDALIFRGHVPEQLGAQWRENLGTEITWKTTMDWATFRDRLDTEGPHMFGLSWVSVYADPDYLLRACPARRWTGWRYEAYDRLVEEARGVADQGERMSLYHKADVMLVQEAAIMPLGYTRLHLLVKPWVSRFPTSTIRRWFCKDVIIEPH